MSLLPAVRQWVAIEARFVRESIDYGPWRTVYQREEYRPVDDRARFWRRVQTRVAR